MSSGKEEWEPRPPEGKERRRLLARARKLVKELLTEQSPEKGFGSKDKDAPLQALLVDTAMRSFDQEVEEEAKRQKRRWYDPPTGRLRKAQRQPPLILQQLVLETLRHYFWEHPIAQAVPLQERSEELYQVIFLVYLVSRGLDRHSLQMNAAINGVLYRLTDPQAASFEAMLTEHPDGNSEYPKGGVFTSTAQDVQRRRRRVHHEVRTWMSSFRSEQGGHNNAWETFVIDDPVSVKRIERILAALAPWEGSCKLPDGIEDKSYLRDRQYLSDIHSKAPPLGLNEAPALERNRFFAIIEPSVHRRLCAYLSEPDGERNGQVIVRKIHMPKFLSDGNEADPVDRTQDE